MKKLTFAFMAFVLAAVTFMTSCHKDDDDDSTPMASITATGSGVDFSATAFSKATAASESSDATGSTNKLSELFKSNTDRITIFGTNKNKQFMSITVNASKSEMGTFHGGINATDILIQYLQGGGSSILDAVKNSIDAFIIFKDNSAASDANSDSFWFSTSADVTITGSMDFGKITYMTGTFTATLMNKSKQTKTISGNFMCPGI